MFLTWCNFSFILTVLVTLQLLKLRQLDTVVNVSVNEGLRLYSYCIIKMNCHHLPQSIQVRAVITRFIKISRWVGGKQIIVCRRQRQIQSTLHKADASLKWTQLAGTGRTQHISLYINSLWGENLSKADTNTGSRRCTFPCTLALYKANTFLRRTQLAGTGRT